MNEIEKTIELMKNELSCINRNINGCDRICQNCDLVKTDDELLFAFNMAILALENQKRLKRYLKQLKECYNKADIMLIQEVIDIVDDCIVESKMYDI